MNITDEAVIERACKLNTHSQFLARYIAKLQLQVEALESATQPASEGEETDETFSQFLYRTVADRLNMNDVEELEFTWNAAIKAGRASKK